ncbi:MAG: hypothetical protein LBD84_03740 [Campylobacteraceae bacterium]|jgi:hypothetical protein|nr:hypothetical protein [Campylobacteraceae bacterium]
MSVNKQQHLDFIQNTITRLNENSFKIKELSVLLTTAIIAIYATGKSSKVLLAAIFPIFILWVLDAYYLQQERKFRGIYEDVAELKKQNTVKEYEMPIDKYNSKIDKKFRLISTLFSKTIFWFYALIIFVPAIFYLTTK